MDFSGKYVMYSHENLETLMKTMGIPDELIKKTSSNTTTYEIDQKGKVFKIKATIGDTVIQNSFTLGEEADMDIMTGEKVKAVFNQEGDNRLVVNMKGVHQVIELSGDTLTATMTHGDITAKRFMKRV